MKRLLFLCAAGMLIATILSTDSTLHRALPPVPTHQEEGNERLRREAWFELMHQSAPDTDWRQIEYQNRLQRHTAKPRALQGRSACDVLTVANGQLQGRWQERGSGNQAGSVFDTEYDPLSDEIWLISAGGTLWRGARNGSRWQVVNQDLQFNPGLLRFIPRIGGRRLLAFAGRMPHYSDDDGYTWTPAEGLSYADRWGDFHSPVLLDDEARSLYFFGRANYWNDVVLYKSVDQGTTCQAVKTFPTRDFDNLQLYKPHHSGELLLMEKNTNGFAVISRINPTTDAIEVLNQGTELRLNTAPANVVAWSGNGLTRLYTYTTTNGTIRVHTSDDYGKNWTVKGFLPKKPWEVGLYVSPSNPDALLMGEVECYRSLDGGANWLKINNWWDYYNNVAGKLHADMMHFAEFNTATGTPFLLISHHGGLTISSDFLASQNNISLWGLNTSQYYSVRTDPHSPHYVYAGSQDQGLQISSQLQTAGVLSFDQVISGDYGHLVFSRNGRSLWTVYPGGDVSYYASPRTGRWMANYEVNSEHTSVWLPPLMPSPLPEEDVVYLAGGNVDGGRGSHLIRLEAVNQQRINASQLPFDFHAQSGGGVISAMAASPLNPDLWYVATTNGRFFYSVTAGQHWTQNLNFVPDGHYLYGQTIYPSRTEIGTVYLGGSGYSNPPVYKSVDGGRTFTPMSTGLPATLVLGLAANTDESLLFAATEAGPFVYVQADERWYDMAGHCAPAQTYWSVEFVAAENTVRFGTYGRGIWDFQIETTVAVPTPALAANALRVFPNPSSGTVFLDLADAPNPVAAYLQVFDIQGKMVHQTRLQGSGHVPVELAHLPKGTYLLQWRSGRENRQARLLLH
ncbi:MAG TPA: T9SS type A sorting domain-containing protein [Saprospiraceae bacterium]|nr:T9SS type A sorting domain-containing protein [Saprospiraceae bacterium]HMP24381.1 T9SS type A sorting domain-containing protein [Saprospiraceae bacterium]